MANHKLFALAPILTLTAACGCLTGMGCGNSAEHSPTPPTNANTKPAPATVTYTCPMHPEVVASVPGSCPKCGMALVLKK
jgi:hypothetical protein